MAVAAVRLGVAFDKLVLAVVIISVSSLAACSGESERETVAAPAADLSRHDFDGPLDNGCLTTGCHQQLSKKRWVHGPTAAQACGTCHEEDSTASVEHRFRASVEPRELCLRCHKVDQADEFIHEPYGSANCISCHDPHGGEQKNFLLTEQVEDLCISCHPSDAVAVPHQPREKGDCLSCHESHSSRHEHLLLRQEGELCSACHREFRDFLAENIVETNLIAGVHPALLTEGCLACHQAHGSERHAMMRDDLKTNCQRCHSDLSAGIEEAEVVHAAFGEDESCILCHTPHASAFDGLLAATPEQVCFQCHAEDVQMSSGRTIGSIEAKIANSTVVHLPVAEGDCTVCHIAHFSPQRSLLRLKYPHKIYGEFSGGSYDLCFQCHDSHLVEEEGSQFTSFRDGERNLHFLHVNSDKGRACDICHDPHATNGIALVRDYYPFGPSRWPLPLGFEATETGGTCTTACHEVSTYTR